MDNNEQLMNNFSQEQPQNTKNRKPLIIGIVAAVAVIAIVAVVLIFVLGNSKNGTYSCDLFSAVGGECTLKINGSKFTLTMDAMGQKESQKGTVKFSGNTVKLTIDGETVKGKYDSSKKTITLDLEGMELVFKKK